MNDLTFTDRVKKHFSYLESKYRFRVTNESSSTVRPQTDGAIEYISDMTGVLIDSETGYVSIRFYRIKDSKNHYITPVDIHEYLSTNEHEKQLLLSTDPKNQVSASALFNDKFLLNQPAWKGSRGTVPDVERELGNFANWLRENANLCIEGDFSQWPKFYEYKIHRARADRLRRGKDEMGYARVQDKDGTWKFIKQSIFKEDLEHVEKLKKEFSK